MANMIDFVLQALWLGTLLNNRRPILAAITIGLALLWGIYHKLFRARWLTKIEWAILLCLAYWVCNYFWSGGTLDNLVSYDFLRRDGALLVSYTAFFALLNWPLKPRACRAMWILFVSALGLLAIPGMMISLNLPVPDLFLDLQLVSTDLSTGHPMYFAWYEAHNSTGGVYALAALIALGMIQEEELSFALRSYLWFFLLACVGGLAFTYSRSGYLAFAAGSAFVLPLRKLRRMIRAGLLVVVPVALLILTTSPIMSRIDTIRDPYYGTNAERLRIWGDALDDIALSPLVGIGFGRFNDKMVQFWGVKHLVWVGVKGDPINDDSHAHNSYLHFGAEGGIVGLLLVMGVWWFAWGEHSWFQHKFPGSQLRWFHRSAKGCMVAVLVQSLAEHVMGKGSVVLVMMAFVATTLIAARYEVSRNRVAESRAGVLPDVSNRSVRRNHQTVPVR
jgi:O-antigen ligase